MKNRNDLSVDHFYQVEKEKAVICDEAHLFFSVCAFLQVRCVIQEREFAWERRFTRFWSHAFSSTTCVCVSFAQVWEAFCDMYKGSGPAILYVSVLLYVAVHVADTPLVCVL